MIRYFTISLFSLGLILTLESSTNWERGARGYYLALHLVWTEIGRVNVDPEQVFKKKLYLLQRFREGKPLSLEGSDDDFVPARVDLRASSLNDLFPQSRD